MTLENKVRIHERYSSIRDAFVALEVAWKYEETKEDEQLPELIKDTGGDTTPPLARPALYSVAHSLNRVFVHTDSMSSHRWVGT